MFGFKKKVKENKRENERVDEPQVPPCSHKWKDFSWYINATYYFVPSRYDPDGRRRRPYGTFEIVEPYVCIHCKERKNVVLDRFDTPSMSYEDFCRCHLELIKLYSGKAKSKPLVEDEINDFQLVDAEYLKVARQLFPDRNI